MPPIKWVVVAKDADDAILERYFSRHLWKVKRAVWRFEMEVAVSSIEVVLLCPGCGEEAPECNCTPRQIAAEMALQSVS